MPLEHCISMTCAVLMGCSRACFLHFWLLVLGTVCAEPRLEVWLRKVGILPHFALDSCVTMTIIYAAKFAFCVSWLPSSVSHAAPAAALSIPTPQFHAISSSGHCLASMRLSATTVAMQI